MATIRLPTDFKEFLQLLNTYEVKYLLVGGYAVGYHGYPRATLDMDIWMTWSTYPDPQYQESKTELTFFIGHG